MIWREPSNLHNVIETIGLIVITKLWLFFICRIKDKIEVKQNIQNFESLFEKPN